MAQTNFIDHVKLNLRSGHGGAGAMHFRREKHVPLGGPDGGDGGRGGNIVLKGSSQLWTLLHLKYRKHVIADDGGRGGGSGSSGAQGKDVILEVPIGTVAKNAETGKVEGEIVEDGQELIIAPGGRGGQGNMHFKTSTNQAPRHSQPGEPGVDEWFVLELKLLADVGLVGFPNAGKSTLLASISAARPEIADYAFTTLTPNLGVIPYRDFRSFVMADIPGIIEGASQGKGLGIRFLRHIERNSILLFMIPADAEDINEAYRILLSELEQYNPELLDKQRLLAITKVDLLDSELQQMVASTIELDIPHLFISAVSNTGLDKLKDRLWEMLQG